MSASLVGSEMCIRDRLWAAHESSRRDFGESSGEFQRTLESFLSFVEPPNSLRRASGEPPDSSRTASRELRRVWESSGDPAGRLRRASGEPPESLQRASGE
eukprot:629333-Alexandrium_andersonii.AAC.1